LKQKNNKAVMTIIWTLAFILLASGIFYGTYYLIINKSSTSYESDIKAIVTKINEVNNSTSDLLKGQTIDLEKIKKEMPDKIDTLSKQKEELSSMATTDTYKKNHDNLISGVDKNILIYRQIDAIVRNPQGKDVGKAGEDLQKFKDQALDSYALVNIKNIKIALPDSSLKLVDYTSNYVYELVKLNRDKEISQNQNLEFINSLDALILKFSTINIDLAAQMSKVRNEKGNMDNVTALANKNEDELSIILQEFSSLTVPSKAVNCYKLFKTTLENFDNYLESFIYSANNEKLAGSDLTAEKIKEIYAEPNSRFSNITKGYNSFLKAYSEFREAAINQ
jgi:hypothetical protein